MQTGGSGGPRSSRTSRASGGPRYQSGVPAPGSQPPNDPSGLGLPDLSDYSSRPAPGMMPRVSPPFMPVMPDQPHLSQPPQAPQSQPPAQQSQPQTSQTPHTLGITSKLARIRATGSPSLPPYSGTLTQQIRAVEPPDVAGQTLEQQKMLAHELITLPDALETSGLAKTHEQSYNEAVNSYVDLAHSAWIAIAEERLEQSGAEETYRESAITIARRIARMQNESQLAASNTQFPLPRKRPLLWRRRVQLRRAGLLDWQSQLRAPANPYAMGAALARLRGATALASASNLELLLWNIFTATVGDVIMVLWLGFVIALIAVLAQGTLATVGALALAATATLAARVVLAQVLRHGPARLDYLYALSDFGSFRSPRAGRSGARLTAHALRIWALVVMVVGMLGMAAALGYRIWQLVGEHITAPHMALNWVALVGSLIVRATLLPALVGVIAVGALALPLLLISAIRFIGELGGNIGWVPAARRYALAPSLQVLMVLAAGAIAALAVLAPHIGLHNAVLTHLTVGPLTQPISLQTVALFVVPALLLLLGLDVPYRIGVLRWRRHWLKELTTRRADIDAHVRRLSAVDPQTGMQDVSEENLRAMQYDLVLLQFYTTRTEETRHVSTAPYGLLAGVGFALLLAVAALLADGVAQQLAHLLLNVG